MGGAYKCECVIHQQRRYAALSKLTNQSMGSTCTSHRSRVDSARAHVCTPTHMNVSINTKFDAPSSTVAVALRLPLLPIARLLARIPVRIAPPSPRCLLLLVVGLLYNSVDDIKGCFYIFFIHFFINIYNMHLIINSYQSFTSIYNDDIQAIVEK